MLLLVLLYIYFVAIQTQLYLLVGYNRVCYNNDILIRNIYIYILTECTTRALGFFFCPPSVFIHTSPLVLLCLGLFLFQFLCSSAKIQASLDQNRAGLCLTHAGHIWMPSDYQFSHSLFHHVCLEARL